MCGGLILAQTPELGRIERNGTEAILIVDGGRPVDSAASTLAEAYGIRINVEDPVYIFKDDIEDVTATVAKGPIGNHRVLVPKGGRLEVRFSLNADGKPVDAAGVVRSLVEAANARFPFQYRLDVDGNWFTIVPTRTRDQFGQSIPAIPLMDRRVTIVAGVRPIWESAKFMADALSVQTGLQVSCCQAFVAGVPWGLGQALFSANDQSARSALKWLITTARGNQPAAEYWLQRCDPLPSGWCFINLKYVSPGH
jgi:hypothetical protein